MSQLITSIVQSNVLLKETQEISLNLHSKHTVSVVHLLVRGTVSWGSCLFYFFLPTRNTLLVINVLSDNPNRANADVKSTVNKRHAKIAEQGSVLFMYDRKGKVEVPAALDEEQLLDAAIEADIDDFLLLEGDEEDTSIVYVEPTESAKMLGVVNTMGYEEAKMSLAWVTKAPVECTDEDFDKNMHIIEALEELDDVDSVEHNMSN
mmetsp:Transcript_17860/g.44142  ORF Transcript_17860/g.44142 Transcript_17860/m.44142 type:complete len:206 (+) Transcript_17860:2799-3416(+)